ncbi:MAG: thiamine phosphate synthase [Alphaproteobacteria bacterium]
MGASQDLRLLSAVARTLKRRNGRPALPALLFFTDPQRTPNPLAVAQRLPSGAAVVYRHFGAPERKATAQALLLICRRRKLKLLIGADWSLAGRIGADGVHLPERLARFAQRLRRTHPQWLITVAAHRRLRPVVGADAAVLAPIFPSTSPSAKQPLGARTANGLARRASLPIYGLGGVNARNCARLYSFAGLAAVKSLA